MDHYGVDIAATQSFVEYTELEDQLRTFCEQWQPKTKPVLIRICNKCIVVLLEMHDPRRRVAVLTGAWGLVLAAIIVAVQFHFATVPGILLGIMAGLAIAATIRSLPKL